MRAVMAAWAAVNVALFWSVQPIAVANAVAFGILLGLSAKGGWS